MKIALILVTILTWSLAWAGGTSVVGGGQGVICGDKVELLDLYEARRAYKLEPRLAGDDILSQLDSAEETFFNYFSHHSEASGVFSFAKDLAHSQSVTFVSHKLDLKTDYGPLRWILEEDCRLIQVAVYGYQLKGQKSVPVVLIDKNYWNRMSQVDQAALLLHEAFHFYFSSSLGARMKEQFDAYPRVNRPIRNTIAFLTATTEYQAKELTAMNQMLNEYRAVFSIDYGKKSDCTYLPTGCR